jgi:hypothetical protein
MARLIHLPLTFILLLSLLAGLGIGLVFYVTPQGLGLSDDSIAYIAGARSLLNGRGYREAWLASNGPVTHFPPGFSTLLALIGLSGIDPLRGTRLLNSVLFGVNIFLAGLIGWRMTASKLAGTALALLFGANASILRVHSVAMSEALYIFFGLMSFLALSFFFEIKKNIWLFVSGSLVACAYLTRYAGLSLAATFILAFFIMQRPWRKRVMNSLIFLSGFVPLPLAWSIRNRLLGDTATNRILIYHPLTSENLKTGIYNFSEFLFPVETWRRIVVQTPYLFESVLGIIGLVLLGWLIRTAWRSLRPEAEERPEVLSFVNALYVFGYLASILSSMLLFDASTKFRLRILSPVYVSLLILLVYLGSWAWRRGAFFQRGTVMLFLVLILGLSAMDTFSATALLRKGGQGYASFQWYDSEAMDYLRSLPEGTRIYTNQPGPVYLYTDRPCYVLPDLIDPVTALPREGYERGVAALQADVTSGQAVLALFKFGSEAEDVQSIYMQLAEELYLAHDTRGDKIYTAFP